MENLTLVESAVWDGVERRAGGADRTRIGIVLTRVRRPTSMQSPPQRCAAPTPDARDQPQLHERKAEALQ